MVVRSRKIIDPKYEILFYLNEHKFTKKKKIFYLFSYDEILVPPPLHPWLNIIDYAVLLITGRRYSVNRDDWNFFIFFPVR